MKPCPYDAALIPTEKICDRERSRSRRRRVPNGKEYLVKPMDQITHSGSKRRRECWLLMPEKRPRFDCESDEGFHQRCESVAAALESCRASQPLNAIEQPLEHLVCSGTAHVPVEHLVAAGEAPGGEEDVLETVREEKKKQKKKRAAERISHPTQPSSFWSIWCAAVLAAVLLLHWWSIWMQLEGKGSSGGGRSRKKQLLRSTRHSAE